MDLFSQKNVRPMLIGMEGEPFDHPDYLYELKLDGERCVAYLSEAGTELRNKRNVRMLPKVPELSEIHRQVKVPCVLDGELIVIKNGVPDFAEIQRRSLMGGRFKIGLSAERYPATFTAFDILYYDGERVTDRPLTERKALLEKAFKENDRLARSRYIEREGRAFFALAKSKNLEGIVAKHKDSRYKMGVRTKDWIKIKFLREEDFVICGYVKNDDSGRGIASLILGQYDENRLIYQGQVTIGVGKSDFARILRQPEKMESPFGRMWEGAEAPFGRDGEAEESLCGSGGEAEESLYERDGETEKYFCESGGERGESLYRTTARTAGKGTVYIEPELVCAVTYMERTKKGGMRQPVFKGLRNDKTAAECQKARQNGKDSENPKGRV